MNISLKNIKSRAKELFDPFLKKSTFFMDEVTGLELPPFPDADQIGKFLFEIDRNQEVWVEMRGEVEKPIVLLVLDDLSDKTIDKYIRKLKTHNWDLRNVGAIWRLKNLTNKFEYEIRVADESSFARKRRQMKCPVQIC